jgi:hypothetical protein
MFKLNLVVNAGVPTIQTQVCPFQLITVEHLTDLHTWGMVQTLIADKYGNISWTDLSATGQIGFCRALILEK